MCCIIPDTDRSMCGILFGMLISAILSVSKPNIIKTLRVYSSVSSPTAGLSTTVVGKPKQLHCPRLPPPSPIGKTTLGPRFTSSPTSMAKSISKPKTLPMLNGDGIVNILDLVEIANKFGTTQGDLNGDGTTNILDLTLVAQQFSQ